MSQIMSTSAEPAYLARLGLTGLPFGKLKQTGDFYSKGQQGQNRKLLLHLLRSTSQHILIQADVGLGKTTLLQSLDAESVADLRFCQFNASLELTQIYADIGSVLARQNEAFLTGDSELAALEQLLRNLQQRHIKPVLLVDNVEQLSAEQLQALATLASKQHEGKLLLQVVLSCTRLTSPVQQFFPSTHSISLAPLSAYDVEPYLMHRLQTVGFKGECPFDEDELKILYKKSKGNIAELNLLANQMLLRGKSKVISFSIPKLSESLVKIVAGTMALILVLLILIFQDDINQWITANPEMVIEDVQPDLNLEDEIVAVETEQVKTSSHAASPQDELAELLAELDSTVENVAEETPTELEIVIEQHADTEQADNMVYDQNWILSQSGTDYTYQLKGAWTQQEITDYIQQYALTGELATFTSLRNDKPWYVLVYGVYKNKDAAIKASSEWPAPLNTLPTWLRRFDSVQKQITEHPVTP